MRSAYDFTFSLMVCRTVIFTFIPFSFYLLKTLTAIVIATFNSMRWLWFKSLILLLSLSVLVFNIYIWPVHFVPHSMLQKSKERNEKRKNCHQEHYADSKRIISI